VARKGAVHSDLLARICGELQQRMEELRPLCEEYERLTEAVATLESVEQEAAHAGTPAATSPPETPAAATPPETAAPTPPPKAAAARRRGRPPRDSAVKAITSASAPTAPAAGASPSTSAPTATAAGASPSTSAPTEIPTDDEPALDEPEPKRARISSSEVGQAIMAALEHGSHTVSELVMVTAMSPTEIRGGLSRLRRQRKVTKVKRPGDGKSAYALPLPPVHA
jgi:hypothetical protein